MTIGAWGTDTRDLLRRSDSPVRPFVALVILAIAIATGVLFVLPLGQTVDDFASNFSFISLALIVIAVASHQAWGSRGAHRLAWTVLAASFGATTLAYALDPQTTGSELAFALDIAVVPSIGFWVAVVVLAAPALPGLASLRTAADAFWVTAALLIALWPWTIGPLLALEGPTTFETVLHVAFALSVITLSTTVLVIIPHTAGRGRIALWMLGIGGAVTSAAGVLHIRFHYEGTLEVGSWWDYLWTPGIGLLAMAGLVTAEGELRPRRCGVGWHAGITVFPLILAGGAIVAGDPGNTRLAAALILLTALALRVLAILAENERLTLSLADEARNDPLTDEARNDPLTGLGNRRALERGIGPLGDLAAGAGRLRAVIVIDLDRFKDVNDTHGHLVGDEVLKLVARRLRDAVRAGDLLVRHGGDEFVAVVTVRDEAEARRAAERLGAAVRGTYTLPVGPLEVGATMGVALDRGQGDLDDLMGIADDALYTAKSRGRGTVHVETGQPV